mgnify:CR=1 FL=1
MKDLTDLETARRFVDAASPAAGLSLDADEAAAVAVQVQIMAGMAAQMPTELEDVLEPAPRFEP